MVFEIQDTSKVCHLFEGWEETLIYSCIQRVMGKIYADDTDNPTSALAYVGSFGFVAGKPDYELLEPIPSGFSIVAPQSDDWAEVIENSFPDARKVIRYAIKKDTVFDTEKLEAYLSELPEGYEIHRIDSDIYDKCLLNRLTADFVASFESKAQFLKDAIGYVITRDGNIVSGASTYSRYKEGIEIEVDTVESERRKHLALAACSKLILECIGRGLYPSWDAQNMNSVRLACKLGYEMDREYIAYEIVK